MAPQANNVIIEKIRKIHALAERASTEAEAAVAAARVQELLLKHNLELGEVVLKEDPGGTVEAGRAWHRTPGHATALASACNDMFDVLFYFRGGRAGWRIVFIGLKDNVEAAAVTYEYLMESVEALARGAKAQNLISGIDEFMAFRYGVGARIRDIALHRKAETLVANPGYVELVHIGNDLAQKLKGAIKFSGSRGGGAAWLTMGTAAYSQGYEQGDRVDLAGARTNRMLK